eukprot:scaffold112508_cov61-Phaeocystis_antarctica.AAC.5
MERDWTLPGMSNFSPPPYPGRKFLASHCNGTTVRPHTVRYHTATDPTDDDHHQASAHHHARPAPGLAALVPHSLCTRWLRAHTDWNNT